MNEFRIRLELHFLFTGASMSWHKTVHHSTCRKTYFSSIYDIFGACALNAMTNFSSIWHFRLMRSTCRKTYFSSIYNISGALATKRSNNYSQNYSQTNKSQLENVNNNTLEKKWLYGLSLNGSSNAKMMQIPQSTADKLLVPFRNVHLQKSALN